MTSSLLILCNQKYISAFIVSVSISMDFCSLFDFDCLLEGVILGNFEKVRV